MEFLSASWFNALQLAVDGARLSEDRTGSFEFVAGGTCSHLVIEAGRVVEFASGGLPTADIGLAWSSEDAVRIAWGTVSGTEAMAATTMSVPASGAEFVGPPAPLGLMTRPEVDALPELFGASLRAQFVHPGGPFGEFGRVLDFAEGRIVDEQWGFAPTCDVMVKVSCRGNALVGLGRQSILEALEDGGEIGGDLAAMATLAAILETGECQALMRPGAGRLLALATLGELRADRVFSEGFARVMAETELP